MKEETKKTAKASYEPPVLKKIDLKAEEVLATGCKLAGEAGPGGFCETGPCSADAGS